MAASLDDACAGMTPEQIVASDHERARICAEMDLLNTMAVKLRERGFDTAVAEAAFETMAVVAIELGGELVMTLRVPGLGAVTIERPSDILEP